ncbi:MAG TPA: LytS/YhcK type 5TM receptor domain-containing protein [Virgibacillus sp.]|nr:LytS/YhcK type 5TM receptor domain-containing protein [Virgibacillus sp.]
MLDLLLIMFERVGTIIAIAFILTRFAFFKNMIRHDKLDGQQEIKAILFFAMFGIAGTYLGFTLNTTTLEFNSAIQGVVQEEAIANSRVIGVVIAGLLGGYRVGLGAGLISGIHRMMLGGFTALACGISTIIAGFLSGYFYKRKKSISPTKAMIISGLAEAMQMGVILLVATPFEKSFAIVQVIGLPMILTNGFGAGIFMLIIQSVINTEKRTIASQAEKTLRIADQTITYLRQGLTAKSAQAVCTILYDELQASGVAMTNKTHILAHIGFTHGYDGEDVRIQTAATKEVLLSGQTINRIDENMNQDQTSNRLGGMIIAPLMEKDRTIGTLKVYYDKQKSNESIHIELIEGLSKLLSEQLEIGGAERTLQLAKEAEINALQAQINPHFLFNSINIIVSLIRTNPEEARTLLNELSIYIRKNVTGTSAHRITLKEELAHVQAYLAIIEARFIDRLHIHYELDFAVMTAMVPPFILQPLVENAIHHGFRDKDTDCELTISIVQKGAAIDIAIIDNGRGIDKERSETLLHKEVDSETGTGIGLYNVNRRLVMRFGEESKLRLESIIHERTKVHFTIPIEEDTNEDATSINR